MTYATRIFHEGQVVTLRSTGEKVRVIGVDSDPTVMMWIVLVDDLDHDLMVDPDDVSRSRADIDADIQALFARTDVRPDGPGEEAFWNAVEDLEVVDPDLARELTALADEWLAATEESPC